jgi:uncharacterized protein YecE (DUF72 family)
MRGFSLWLTEYNGRVPSDGQPAFQGICEEMERRVGTAGWTLPRDVRDRFPAEGAQLERYAQRFSCVEINSSFYRPHRRTTYSRWAASVPDDFRFALKLPKEITHTRRLIDAAHPLAEFLDASSGLDIKRDVLLVQLPPSFEFNPDTVRRFFALLRAGYSGRVACEPRHASWFEPAAEEVLAAFHVARVAADPPPPGANFEPGGASDFCYWRLHGAPRVYYSPYDRTRLDAIAATIGRAQVPVWCIFDNTAAGAATANALDVLTLVEVE